ncbi:hypothetical protein [Arthrobacter sp. JZ12]|uniref:FMN-binding protein n=1 Tax=Arthrobacter sp. JZ12 TaxID=2654190 RepID=UPI002B474582|nr:hypothetical protein [Arthrobacter sp. JZ12]
MTDAVQPASRRWALAGLAAASLLSSAACAATPPASGGGNDGGPAGGNGAGSYADGTYTATGSYQTPGGEESIGVTVTLESGAVADVQMEPMPSNPTTELYQGKFSSGIKDEIVGTPIDELDVSRVSGSSLTSGGFRDAIEQIKGDAGQ